MTFDDHGPHEDAPVTIPIGIGTQAPEPETAFNDPVGPTTLPPASEPRRGAGPLVVAVVALIAALIGGGVVAAVDRVSDDQPATAPAGSRRNTSVITHENDVQSILAKVQPGVVSIQTEQFQRGIYGDVRRTQGAGTGMILTPDGEVLTNAHVVAGAQRIEVTLDGEKEARVADLVGGDPAADIAVIRIRDAKNLPTVTLGTSGDLVVGDDVIAIGNALALAGGLSVTEGIVSALNRTLDEGQVQFDDLIQTDAAINNGNSGGPLVNAAGEVIGINTVVIQQSGGNLVQNVGFAIAVDAVKPLIEDLRRGQGRVGSAAYLGVNLQNVTAEIADQLGLPDTKGAIVITVAPGSPAAAAGLERFDVITRIGDVEVDEAQDVTAAVARGTPGATVEVRYVRGTRTRTATVTLGSRQIDRRA